MNRVLLVNANNNVALAIARGLGQFAVPITGVGWKDGGVGLFSRYIDQKVWIEDCAALDATTLCDLLAKSGARYVIGMGEDVLTHLNTLRAAVPTGVKYLFPEDEVLARAFDKSATLRFAAEVGVDHPKTLGPDPTDYDSDILDALRYPVILKFPRSVGPPRPPELRFASKIVQHCDELGKVLEVCRVASTFPLIQEYIPGKGIGVELCMFKGEVVAAFQHERIHELPLAGGPGVYRQSVPLSPDLLRNSTALLRAMEWEGVAMVEYRRDSQSGRTALMEVNGRFWGSLPLAIRSGANFPYALYTSMGEGQPFVQPPYTIGTKVKQSGGHLRWFWKAFVQRGGLPPEGFMSRSSVLTEFLRSWTPSVKYDIEEWDDPVPGIRYWLSKFHLA